MKKPKRHKQTAGSQVNGSGPVRREEPASWKKQKLLLIEQALASDPVDTRTLREAAASNGGLLNDSVRRRVWPKLLNINSYELPPKPGRQVREQHKDFNQVHMDIRRSVRRFPKGMRAEEREVLQQQMIDSILEVLRRNPQLHYYQGYHDIVVTFLLVVGERTAIAIVEKLSNHHLRDFMDPTMDSTKHILNYLMPILEQAHPLLHSFLLRAEVGTIFALSWLITWYSHVLSELRLILRLYDFFLASHPLMPIYYAASIVLHREKEVLNEECDMAMLHHLLSHLPKDLPYQQLIGQAQELISQYPPSFLAQRAALQYRNSITISSFQSFHLSTLQQRPDSVLRLQSSRKEAGGWRAGAQDREAVAGQASRLVRVAVWGLSASLGAAVLAVAQTALDWTPDLLMQLF